MESTPRRRYTTHYDEEVEESLRSKRSSIAIRWSDGSKAIFIRPPRPHSSWGSASPSHLSSPSLSPPPIPPRPAPAPAPNRQRSRTPHVDTHWAGSSHTPRPRYDEVRQGTPRSSRAGNGGPSSSHFWSRTPTGNSVLGRNINRSQSAPSHLPSVNDDRTSTDAVVGRMSPGGRRSRPRHGQSRSQSQPHDEQLHHELRQMCDDQGSPDSPPLVTAIRGGSGTSLRQGRAGETSVRSADGGGGFGNSGWDEMGHDEDRAGDVLRGLRRCFPFACWLFGEIGDDHRYDNRSRPGSRSRHARRH